MVSERHFHIRATDAYLPIPGNGSYEVEVELTNGCRVRTAAYPYFSTGTEAVAAMRTWMDATGRVHLLVPGGSPTQQELTILDTQGLILERMVMAAHTTELPLPEVPGAGIRLVRVVGPQGSWTLPYVAP